MWQIYIHNKKNNYIQENRLKALFNMDLYAIYYPRIHKCLVRNISTMIHSRRVHNINCNHICAPNTSSYYDLNQLVNTFNDLSQ